MLDDDRFDTKYGLHMTEWVAIDFETANEFRGSPCAVAMIRVENDVIVDRFTTLIQPPTGSYFSPFCTSLHGITAEAVRNAPTWPTALAEIRSFTGERILIAHNAAFDMGVIRSEPFRATVS
jgi:DNA polymerase III epsilon subunit-like protein